MPLHTVPAGPLQDRPAGKLGSVVADDASGFAIQAHQRVQLADHPHAGDAGVPNPAQILPAAIIIDRQRRTRWTQDPRNKGKRYPEPPPPDTTDLPTLPEGWTWASFPQICEVETDQGLKLKEKEYQAAGKWPVIDQGARTVAGYTDRDELIQRPDRPWILFGDHTRRFKPVHEPFCIGADGIKIIAPATELDFEFMLAAFRAAQFEYRGYSRHFQFVRALSLPVPPLEEQREIVRLLAAAEGEGGQLAGDVDNFGATSSQLRQSILAAAFRGELAA
jgi:hypothetical protein